MANPQPRTVRTDSLEIAYFDEGPADGIPAILLHGFPYDTHAYDEVVPHLVSNGLRCVVPYLRGYGATRFLSDATCRSGEQAALGSDLLALMDALAIDEAIVGGYDWGGRAACIVSALWPARVRGLVSCGQGYNIQNIAAAANPASPEAEYRYWYQYYFQSERGRSGLQQNRRELCRLLWQLWSPTWQFSVESFEQTAASFDNPDFVDVVIHSYRHRYGLVDGDPELTSIESQLAAQPAIEVPSVVLLGGDDGVSPPAATDVDARHFSGPYQCQRVAGAGHNLPQESPDAFAKAILSLT